MAIGGGTSDNTLLEKEAVKLTSLEHPRALFIPTAANDHPGYIKWFIETFGRYNCVTSVLCLATEFVPDNEVAESIQRADLIYLGQGGDPRRVFHEIWPKYRLRERLLAASEKALIVGSSAGAMYLGDYGYGHPLEPDKPYVTKGLGLIPGIVCAHYGNPNRPSREEGLKSKLREKRGSAFAIKDYTALVVFGSEYRVLTSAPTGGVFFMQHIPSRRAPVVTFLSQTDSFDSLQRLI